MSPASYRAAPPRVGDSRLREDHRGLKIHDRGPDHGLSAAGDADADGCEDADGDGDAEGDGFALALSAAARARSTSARAWDCAAAYPCRSPVCRDFWASANLVVACCSRDRTSPGTAGAVLPDPVPGPWSAGWEPPPLGTPVTSSIAACRVAPMPTFSPNETSTNR